MLNLETGGYYSLYSRTGQPLGKMPPVCIAIIRGQMSPTCHPFKKINTNLWQYFQNRCTGSCMSSETGTHSFITICCNCFMGLPLHQCCGIGQTLYTQYWVPCNFFHLPLVQQTDSYAPNLSQWCLPTCL